MEKISLWKLIAKVNAVRELVETVVDTVQYVRAKAIADSKLQALCQKMQALVEFIVGRAI
jgi:hypothetical protein